MGVRASKALANPTPVNTGVLSKVFHLYKGQMLYRPPHLYNVGFRMKKAINRDRFHQQWYPYSLDAKRGVRLDDTRWHPFRMRRFFRKKRRHGWTKLHRRRILPDYKQALRWLSQEQWDARLQRKGRYHDLYTKSVCLPAEVIDHYHQSGWYYQLETWPLQWESARRRAEKLEYNRGEFRDTWGNREYPVEVDNGQIAWFNEQAIEAAEARAAAKK